MPLQDLTAPPTPPSRDDPPEVFIERADAFVAWQAQFASEMNTLAGQLEATAALIAVAPAYADPGLLALTGLTPAADRVPYFDGATTSALTPLTAAGRALIDDATAGDQLTTLGLTANGKSLVTAANYAAMRALLDLEAGTDFNAYSAVLAAYAAGASPTAAFLSLADDSTTAAMLATLGAQPALSQSQNGNGYYITVPIGARTYYIQWGIKTTGSNAWTSDFDLPVPYTTEGWIMATGMALGATATDGNKISAILVGLSQFKIGNDDFSIDATWFSWGY